MTQNFSSSCLHLQCWHYRHCQHIQFYVVLEIEARALCVLDEHSMNWTTSPGSQLEERNVLKPQSHVLWTNRKFRVGSLGTSSSFFEILFFQFICSSFHVEPTVYWALQQWVEGWSPATVSHLGVGRAILNLCHFLLAQSCCILEWRLGGDDVHLHTALCAALQVQQI